MPSDEHQRLLQVMRGLAPHRAANAILEWVKVVKPDLYKVVSTMTKAATFGQKQAVLVVSMMMLAFAAGRAYQEANPDAPRDPDGYI